MLDRPLMRRRRLLRTAMAFLIVSKLGVGVSQIDPEPAAAGPAPNAVPTVSAAVKAAKAGGKRVGVLSERTEVVQVFAEPTGRLTYEAAAVPQRVHRGDGSWADIDVRLSESGGTLRPAATLADV
jgi:hypothetical protein